MPFKPESILKGTAKDPYHRGASMGALTLPKPLDQQQPQQQFDIAPAAQPYIADMDMQAEHIPAMQAYNDP
jgi:hypothetical protein